jgi:HEPN domain-containing protein
MSTEKNIIEARRWLHTADDDLDSAIILKENRKFAHSCFHAQQAAEKALKAVWYQSDADPWGHSIKRLIDDLESVDLGLFEIFKNFSRQGALLDRFYIPTRYPNGLPDITPDVAFNEDDANVCIANAGIIIGAVHDLLRAHNLK